MRLYFFIVFFILTACSSMQASIKNTEASLMHAYINFLVHADKETIFDKYEVYFSANMINGKNADKNELKALLGFPAVIQNYSNSIEGVFNGKNCLSLRGYSETGSPVAINIEYVQVNKQWLINALHIAFNRKGQYFDNSLICPSQISH